MISKKIQQNTESGFALLLAIIISSVVLSIGLTILNVTLKQLSLSAAGRESEVAFQMANLGMECARYVREQKSTQLRQAAEGSNLSATTFNSNCAGVTDTPSLLRPASIANSYQAKYSFDVMVNSENRCVKMDINVMSAQDDSYDGTPTKWNYPDGRVASYCEDGNFCTAIVSQGYNRPCAEINSSIFSVQRELTAEF